METLTKNKGILLAVAVFILAMFLYNMFFKSDEIPVLDDLSASSIGDDLLKTFEELRAVTLDESVFSSLGYLELTDFSADISQGLIGRPNPFNIIGRD